MLVSGGINDFRAEIKKELSEGESFGHKAHMYKQTISDIDTVSCRNRPYHEILVPDWWITSHVT